MKKMFANFGNDAPAARFIFKDKYYKKPQKQADEMILKSSAQREAFEKVRAMTGTDLRNLEMELEARSGENWNIEKRNPVMRRGGKDQTVLENTYRKQKFIVGGPSEDALFKAKGSKFELEQLANQVVVAVDAVKSRVNGIIVENGNGNGNHGNGNGGGNENGNHENGNGSGHENHENFTAAEVIETREVNDAFNELSRNVSDVLSGISKIPSSKLRTDWNKLHARVNKLPSSEYKKLKPKMDALLKKIEAIEAREKEKVKIEKKENIQKKLNEARTMVDAIGEPTLENLPEIKTQVGAARAAITAAEKAGATSEQLEKIKTDFEAKEKVYTEKETEKKLRGDLETIEKKQTEEIQENAKQQQEELGKIDEQIKTAVADFEKELAGKKSIEKFEVSPLALDPPDPASYDDVQKGFVQHRIESAKMGMEVDFLQERGSEFAEKIAKFEDEKTELSFLNAGRCIAASVAILPGALLDFGCWGLEGLGIKKNKKRPADWFGDSRAEKLQQERDVFQGQFDNKISDLEVKKDLLDAYGDKLTTSSADLKTNSAETATQGIRASVESTLPAGVDPAVEPWKSLVDQMVENLEKTTKDAIQPSVDELDAKVQSSVMEVSPQTDLALAAADDSASCIHGLKIMSPTVLDMSVGYLTKNVSKGLNWAGDKLAKIPVIGVVGGVLRAAGGLVDGVGTLITDPDKVVEGLLSLSVGYEPGNGGIFSADSWGNWEYSSKARDGLIDALTAKEARENGEGWAAAGEIAGNVASFLFTGGAAGAVRGAGVAGRVGKMAAAVSKVTGKMGTVVKIPAGVSSRVSGLGKRLAKVGKRPLGMAGDLALTSLRWGLKPLKWVKSTSRLGKNVEKILKPSAWKKAEFNIIRSENLFRKAAKYRSKIHKLRAKGASPSKIARYTQKMQTAFKEARRLHSGTPSAVAQSRSLIAEALNHRVIIRNLKSMFPRPRAAGITNTIAKHTRKMTSAMKKAQLLRKPPVPISSTIRFADGRSVAAAAVGTGLAYAGVATANHNDRVARKKFENDRATFEDVKKNGLDSESKLDVEIKQYEEELKKSEADCAAIADLTGPNAEVKKKIVATKKDIAQKRLSLAKEKKVLLEENLLKKSKLARKNRDQRVGERQKREQDRLQKELEKIEQEQAELEKQLDEELENL